MRTGRLTRGKHGNEAEEDHFFGGHAYFIEDVSDLFIIEIIEVLPYGSLSLIGLDGSKTGSVTLSR